MALIPARSGSKGIPHKNIATFMGKPLIAHSIEQARQARTVNRVIVSTDSELYAGIAREYGAETPFLRPAAISGDFSTDLEVFQHALEHLARTENYRPDICVHLRPTYPTRRVADIDRAVELLKSDQSFDSVRSVVKAPETPFKMWFIGENEQLRPVVTSDLSEPWNQPRQALPQAYLQNACVDVVWSRVIRERNSMTGRRIRALVMEDFNDIDEPAQLQAAASAAAGELTGKTFAFDIDGVLATITPNNDYALAEPIKNNIDLVNELYARGNKIVLFTARGSATGKDWKRTTEEQMARWGVKHHELRFGKPPADYFVDDRFIALHDLAAMLKRKKS